VGVAKAYQIPFVGTKAVNGIKELYTYKKREANWTHNLKTMTLAKSSVCAVGSVLIGVKDGRKYTRVARR